VLVALVRLLLIMLLLLLLLVQGERRWSAVPAWLGEALLVPRRRELRLQRQLH